MPFRFLLSEPVEGRGASSVMRRLRRGAAGALVALVMLSGCAKRPPRATRIGSLPGPHFAFNSTELTPEAWSKVWVAATTLNRYPTRNVEVIGYSDSSGTEERNQWLSARRAVAVTEALVRDGVSASRITTRWYGAANPVASNATAEGRAQNRRVEIILE
jgi:outer membrane protein OmpA-like peptidoglycan-associated protein